MKARNKYYRYLGDRAEGTLRWEKAREKDVFDRIFARKRMYE